MWDFTLVNCVVVRSNFYQCTFYRRVGIKPVQTTRLITDESVASINVCYVNKQHLWVQRYIKALSPSSVVECIDTQSAGIVLVNIHHSKLRDSPSHKEPCQNGLVFRGTGDNLVLFKRERCRGNWHCLFYFSAKFL